MAMPDNGAWSRSHSHSIIYHHHSHSRDENLRSTHQRSPSSSSALCSTATMAAAVAERKVKVAEVALRALLCGLAALSAALVATDSQTRTFFSSYEKTATFKDMKAMVFLVAVTGAAAGYSLLQAARCCVTAARPPTASRAVAWCVFSCDQALAYAVLAALAAALQASVIAKRGQNELQWMGICSMYGAFCRQAGSGIASAVGAGLAAVFMAFLSAFNLFRLYGGDKSGGNGVARNGGGGATW